MASVPTQLSLFPDPAADQELPGLNVLFDPAFLAPDESHALFEELRAETPWSQHTLAINGQPVPVPRLLCWYGDERTAEGYGRISLHTLPWTATLLDLKSRVEAASGVGFNSVLASLYRDGNDSVAWHRDYNDLVGKRPVVAAVSLGATRRFLMKRQHRRDLPTLTYHVLDGSLLVMGAGTQDDWLHTVPKTKQPVGERISLTFRRLLDR